MINHLHVTYICTYVIQAQNFFSETVKGLTGKGTTELQDKSTVI